MGLYQWVGPGSDIGNGDNWRDEIHGTTGTEPGPDDDTTIFTVGTLTGELDANSVSLQSQGAGTLQFGAPGAETSVVGEGAATTVNGLVTFNDAALESLGLSVGVDSTLKFVGASYQDFGAGDDLILGSQMGTADLIVDRSSFYAPLNGGTLTVGNGNSGSGMLTIENGSGFDVSAALTLIGGGSGGTGKVLVTGATTEAVFDQRVEIGGDGNGSFTVSDGAYASIGLHDNVAVGSLNGTGTITATGAGSLLSVAGNLELGAYGGVSAGTAIISQGATLAAVGDILDYQGSLTLSGAGSMLSGRQLDLSGASSTLNIGTGATASFITSAVEAGGVVLQGGTLDVRRVLEDLSKISGHGVVNADAIENYATLSATGGMLQVIGAETGSGTDYIARASTLELDGSVAKQIKIAFQAGANTLSLKDASEMAGLIRGFGIGETIDLLGDPSTKESFANDVLTISNGSTVDATLRFTGSYTAANFKLASDGHGGSLVSYVPSAMSSRLEPAHGVSQSFMTHPV